MAATEVILGSGNATGMFYHAPAGTKLPDGPFDTIATEWERVGDITSDGITLNMDKSSENLKNWANKVKRTILTDHSESVEAPIMDTTEDTMKVIFGEDNVKVTPATAEHGKLISVNVSADNLPDPEAFLFLVKDGDAGVLIGASNAQMSSVGSVSFAPGGAINWTATFNGQKDGWQVIVDDGDRVVSA